jgi:hypothetical protein
LVSLLPARVVTGRAPKIVTPSMSTREVSAAVAVESAAAAGRAPASVAATKSHARARRAKRSFIRALSISIRGAPEIAKFGGEVWRSSEPHVKRAALDGGPRRA